MRPVSRLLLGISLVTALATGGAPLAAHADDAGGAGGTAGGFVDGSGNPTAEASTGSTSGTPAAAGTVTSNCTWQLLVPDDKRTAMFDANGKRLYSSTGRWFQKICDGQVVEVNGTFAIPEEATTADPAALAQQARRSVSIPDPPLATSPPIDRRLYTRVQTWLWLDPAWWRSYSATASAGAVSSTVVARPVRAIWTTGDGGLVTCNGSGTPWRRGLSDAQSTCSYTYKNSSAGQAGGTFTMSVEVEFEVSWTSNIAAGGVLARITRTTSRTVEVGEIQAVETG